jgi:hypothetical protein
MLVRVTIQGKATFIDDRSIVGIICLTPSDSQQKWALKKSPNTSHFKGFNGTFWVCLASSSQIKGWPMVWGNSNPRQAQGDINRIKKMYQL